MRASIKPTPLNVGDILTFTPRHVDTRDEIEAADNGGVDGVKLRLIVPRADQTRFGGCKR